ncbi:alpha/beta hydrolase [Rhodococcus sp. PAMC28707]|uniref:alpha/beta fold hydrolase n=1 Tax=unclassified Rhodococcus (in: high G+C Gram-positive bacteria) TaxID=192944 RepID=UPI00109E249C|nr:MULTISPECIES: alpha/beta hydrolase [unclassified Rhodococcus (in: high G+C Gram-positive bacteria)]QCB50987.1 alpha/beta hydrolase [Rhodococcus sp. PAMC28705]QCB57320.1 alpha/beta hydrolase [Rhodococcus sp. PAMC28707]
MNVTRPATHVVVLPGTGSDAEFAFDAFAAAVTAAGATIEAVSPNPTGIVASYEEAMSAAAHRHGRIIVGGISIGAAVALSWARSHPQSVIGVLAVLPPWIADPTDAPAALSARYTMEQLDASGLDAVTAAMEATSPQWLASTLRRSWASQWPDLPRALAEAAAYVAPNLDELRSTLVPTAVIGAVDDPVHPIDVARTWHEEIPNSCLSTLTLADIGSDPGVLGRRSMQDLTSLVD